MLLRHRRTGDRLVSDRAKAHYLAPQAVVVRDSRYEGDEVNRGQMGMQVEQRHADGVIGEGGTEECMEGAAEWQACAA